LRSSSSQINALFCDSFLEICRHILPRIKWH
jgi:hypothetical protein